MAARGPDVLGLPADATAAEVDARFRAIVRQARPDLGAMATEEFVALVAARRAWRQRLQAAAVDEGTPATVTVTEPPVSAPMRATTGRVGRPDPWVRPGPPRRQGVVIDLTG